MKIKIIFSEPPYEAISTQPTNDSEKVIFIKDPYSITKVDGGRRIVDIDGATITYENYCIELQNLIDTTIRTAALTELESCDAITIEGCKEPPNFEALMSTLAKTTIPLASKSQLNIKDCSFGGSLYVNAVTKFVKSTRTTEQNPFFDITLYEQGQSKLSDHDKAKLAALDGVIFYPAPEKPAALRRYIDDQSLARPKKAQSEFALMLEIDAARKKPTAKYDDEVGSTPNLSSRLTNPTYLYRSKVDQFSQQPSPRTILVDFFSQAHQQRSDYTCGPAVLKMVADYYTSMGRRAFCGGPVSQHQTTLRKADGSLMRGSAWKLLNSSTEVELSERVKTTEEVGSDVADMRNGLMELGFPVIDDSDGFSAEEHSSETLRAHKLRLWDKVSEILTLGIPVVVNMRDWEEVGHYEVIIGIDEQQNIILAEPGRALAGDVKFETIPKETFIERWKNMSGEFHGRFLVLPPNEASALRVESILSDMPHYFKGEAINKAEHEGPTP